MSLSPLPPSSVALLFLLLITPISSLPSTIGITYTPSPTPSPQRVAAALHSLKVSSVRLLRPTPALLRAFAYSNISLLLTVPNTLVHSFASNRSAAVLWLHSHVVPYHPRTRISSISVGVDIVDDTSSDLHHSLLPAIRNLHLSLRSLNIRKISVSTTFSFLSIMSTPFPPSSAAFQEPTSELIIRPLLQFLAETNSSFMVNLYPYAVYKLNSATPIGFALFQDQPFNFRDDSMTGIRYRNLFDMMVDSVIRAMGAAGYDRIPIVVTETGWPCGGDKGETDAGGIYAEMYVKGLVKHLKSGVGTPLRKEGAAATFIYELFDEEDDGQGTATPVRWGIFYPNMTSKYGVGISGCISIRRENSIDMVITGTMLLLWFLLLL